MANDAPTSGSAAGPRGRVWPLRLFKAAVVVVAVVLFFRWFERQNVYQPSRRLHGDPSQAGLAFEDVRLRASDGVELHAWFLPARTNAFRTDKVFLVSHGNAGNISHRLDLAERLLETGAAVLLYDYRGYGLSAGRPSEEGTYQDALAAHAWLRGRGFAPRSIVAYGESLGGGVSAELARRETVGALVLQSTFTSLPDVGRELFPFLPVRLLSTIAYDTRAKLASLRVPVLVLHGRGDSIVGFHHAENLFAAANAPKHLAELDGDHNDSPSLNAAAYADAFAELWRMMDE